MAQLAGQLGQQSQSNLANANSPEQDNKLLNITPIKPTKEKETKTNGKRKSNLSKDTY